MSSEPAAPAAAVDHGHDGAPGHWRLVVILMAVYTYAFIDRFVLALLVEPIKADLHASDVAMGLMLGLAFAAFYACFSVPAGHYVDRVDRRRLIAGASVGWAAMTIVCGLATSLPQLFAGRVGVGIAEAVITPAAFSLIRDAVPTRSRGLAFSIFAMSPMIGGAAALIGGGAILKAAEAGAFAALPVLGGLHPWQATLVIAGVFGLPFSLLLLALPEPGRRALGAERTSMVAGIGVAGRYMLARSGVFVPLVLFAAFGAMISFSNSAWLPAALGRRWHLAPHTVGPALGLLTLVGGVAGLFVAGAIINRVTRRGGDIRRFGAVAAVGAAAGIGSAGLAPSVGGAYACAGVGMFFLGTSYAVGAATLATVTPVALMGRVSAIYLLFQNLIGQALGPLLVAWAATRFTGLSGLADGMAVAMAGFAVAAAASALVLGRVLARDPLR